MQDNDIGMPSDSSKMCSQDGFFDSLTEEQATKFYEALKQEIPEWSHALIQSDQSL